MNCVRLPASRPVKAQASTRTAALGSSFVKGESGSFLGASLVGARRNVHTTVMAAKGK